MATQYTICYFCKVNIDDVSDNHPWFVDYKTHSIWPLHSECAKLAIMEGGNDIPRTSHKD